MKCIYIKEKYYYIPKIDEVRVSEHFTSTFLVIECERVKKGDSRT